VFPLGRDGRRGHGVDRVHRVEADVGLDDLARGLETVAIAHLEGALELGELDVDLLLQARPPADLLGVIRRQRLQLREQRRGFRGSAAVRLEIRRVSRDQVTALTSLRVLDRLAQGQCDRDDLVRVRDQFGSFPELGRDPRRSVDLEPQVGQARNDDKRQSGPQQPWQLRVLIACSRRCRCHRDRIGTHILHPAQRAARN
jgi:hypothetical protein